MKVFSDVLVLTIRITFTKRYRGIAVIKLNDIVTQDLLPLMNDVCAKSNTVIHLTLKEDNHNDTTSTAAATTTTTTVVPAHASSDTDGSNSSGISTSSNEWYLYFSDVVNAKEFYQQLKDQTQLQQIKSEIRNTSLS